MTEYFRKNYYQNTEVAETYHRERFTHRRGAARDHALRKALARSFEKLPALDSILDLPCGAGRLSGFFSEHCRHYLGADIAHEMLQVLVRRCPTGAQTTLMRCDGEAIPLKANSIDCVACIRLFQLEIPIDVKRQILEEMYRVSRRWLIVEHMYVKSMRSFGRLRYWLYRARRRERQLPVMDSLVIAAGWHEYARVPLKGLKNWVGIYCKDSSAQRS